MGSQTAALATCTRPPGRTPGSPSKDPMRTKREVWILRVLREQRGAAGTAECLVVAIAGVPAADAIFTAYDAKSPWLCAGRWRYGSSGSSLTAGAVAVHGAEQRLADLKAHCATVAAAG
jgi:hypothetical protein